MRIALTSNFSPWSHYSGGAQRSTHALAEALVARGHEVHVVYTACPWERPEVPADVRYGVHFARFFGLRARRTSPLRSFNAFTVANVLQELQTLAPLDVIHAQGEEGARVSALPFRGQVRFVATPRYPSFPADFGPHASGLTRARFWLLDSKFPVLGYALRAADRITATSEVTAEEVAQRYDVPRAAITVVPNGVHQAFLRARWQGPSATAPLLYFGRLEADKGVDQVIRATAQTDRRLRIVGRGHLEGECRRLVAELGLTERVDFLGWQTPQQLAQLLSESALAVLPSLHESFGNTMAEAMAVGTPLVTTAAGSIPEVVGDTAMACVPPADTAALVQAVPAALSDEAGQQAKSARSRQRIVDRFSWDAVAATYERIYSEPL